MKTDDLDPAAQRVLARFAELSQVPRPSRHEGRVLAWLCAWADAHGFAHHSDAAGNLCVKVPASSGCEKAPSVALQAHVDMVCEKTPESKHDFMNDPIRLVREGDWLRADGTTLGADNGMAVAMILTLAETKELIRPPLELLFTVDEETGLHGAMDLDPNLIASRRLLNLDSEDEGIFTIGCAGGSGTQGTLEIEREAAPGWKSLRVTVGGLQGGHSGVDIHLGRANAIKLPAEAIAAAGEGVRLQSIEGGQAHNAIPRNAAATLAVQAAGAAQIIATIEDRLSKLKQGFGAIEPDFSASVDPVESGVTPLTSASTQTVLRLLRELPHGVQTFDGSQEGLVETSTNLASVRLIETTAEIATSQRSIRMEELAKANARVEAIFAKAGAVVKTEGGYPSWTPDFHSSLLAECRRVHERVCGASPKVEVIHAGLECGVIGAKIPGMDMISFGPTIRHPHSPSEKADLPSVGRVWKFTAELLAALAKPAA